MKPYEINELQDDLYDEFGRWLDRLPCYMESNAEREIWLTSCKASLDHHIHTHILKSNDKGKSHND